MNQLLRAALIFLICPLLGLLLVPSARSLKRQAKRRSQGRSLPWDAIDWSQWSWVLEIIQGLCAVGLAKLCFPYNPEWDMIALMGVAAGRYWRSRSGSLLMMLSGYVLHNYLSGILVFILGGIGSMLFRENRQISLIWLMLMPLITAVRYSNAGVVVLFTAGVAGILYGMEQTRSPEQAKSEAKLFRADSLNDQLNPAAAGELAVNLAQLKQQGLPVPMGWIIYPGDDPESLAPMMQPLERQLWVVRSSFVADQPSELIGDLLDLRSLWAAIVQIFESHAGGGVAAIVQPQIDCLYSGTVYCQAPTMKADVPTSVAELVREIVDRLNQELNTLETLTWGYDGQQVWILAVR